MSKKIPVLVVCVCVAWFLYQGRNLIQLLVYEATSVSSEEVEFPLGENKKITIDLPRSYIKKPYAISLRTEFIDGEKRGGRSDMYKQLNYPYNFTIKCYKIFRGKKKLFFEENFTEKREVFRIGGSNVSNPQNVAFSAKIYHTELEAGKYTFEIIDRSSPNSFYKGIKTSVKIFVYVRK